MMSMDANLTYFERRLLGEIHEIEMRIEALVLEKNALQRQLAKAKAERSGIKLVERKNSGNRVLAENTIIAALRNSKSGEMKTIKLFERARATNFDLKESTFRSYLHRMKKRGEIESGKYVGSWRLTPKLTPPAP